MWWFYTVILGIAFGQILMELAVAFRDWRRVPTSRPFWPAILWQAFLLVLVVQVWIAVTYYRQTATEVPILELVAFLLVPAGILVMSYLLPDVQTDPEKEAQMPAQAVFARIRPVFFGVFIAMVAVNVLHGVITGEQGLDVDLLFQALLVAGAVVGLFLRSRMADVVLALVMIAILVTYIGVAYPTVTALD